jgi:hypothetical protein
MKNFIIQLTRSNYEEIKKWFDKNIPEHNCGFTGYGRFYGVINDKAVHNPIYDESICIKSMSELEEKEKEFPRYMYVSNTNQNQTDGSRLVIGYFNSKYYTIAEPDVNLFLTGCNCHITSWTYAKEIETSKFLELTIDDIAAKYGVNPNEIKIKK